MQISWTAFKFLISDWPWRWIVRGALALAALWALFFFRSLIIGDAEVEADLATEQGSAAIESGADAVRTVGDNQAQADGTRDQVQGVQSDVDQAGDAAGADAAGRDGLCQQFGVCDEE